MKKTLVCLLIAVLALSTALPALSEIKSGDVITFGTFEQNNNSKDGKEPIEWLVLETDGSQAFLLSRYVLTCRKFNGSKSMNLSWSSSSIRKWLNDKFLDGFSKKEQAAIVTTTVDNSAAQSETGACSGGKETKDKVFLLSYAELNTYFPERADKRAVYTDSAIKAVNDGSMTFAKLKKFLTESYDGCYLWYLRSFKEDMFTGAPFPELIHEDGDTSFIGCSPILVYGIRPALVLDLDKGEKYIQVVEPAD
ncbi:MAG: hypothetical protein IKQ41_04965 [Clostridia bacterium]|nr:hypothetical protein [Clostridia bacterium]